MDVSWPTIYVGQFYLSCGVLMNTIEKPLIYKKLADVVFVFHLFWIFLLLTIPPVAIFYSPLLPYSLAITWTTIISQVLFAGCPLLLLENLFRNKYDPKAGKFQGSFVSHYLEKKFGLKISPWFLFIKLVATFFVVLVIFLRTLNVEQ